MTPEAEWDAAVAEQPEHSRIRPRVERGESLEERGIRMYGERAEQERADADRFWVGLSDEDRERVWKRGVAICMPDANGSMRSNVARLANDWAESRGLGLTDGEEERAIKATISRASRAHGTVEQEARIADLHQQRNFYRDSLRRILGVTRLEGEALIALVEVGLCDANLPSVVNTQASDVCTSIEKLLGVQRADQAEPLHKRLARLFLLAIERSKADARAERTLKRWQARARKAEARVAALTEERDGLTLRLGTQVKAEIDSEAAQAPADRMITTSRAARGADKKSVRVIKRRMGARR